MYPCASHKGLASWPNIGLGLSTKYRMIPRTRISFTTTCPFHGVSGTVTSSLFAVFFRQIGAGYVQNSSPPTGKTPRCSVSWRRCVVWCTFLLAPSSVRILIVCNVTLTGEQPFVHDGFTWWSQRFEAALVEAAPLAYGCEHRTGHERHRVQRAHIPHHPGSQCAGYAVRGSTSDLVCFYSTRPGCWPLATATR